MISGKTAEQETDRSSRHLVGMSVRRSFFCVEPCAWLS